MVASLKVLGVFGFSVWDEAFTSLMAKTFKAIPTGASQALSHRLLEILGLRIIYFLCQPRSEGKWYNAKLPPSVVCLA